MADPTHTHGDDAPRIVPTTDEPEWAHVYARTPRGHYEAVADHHLPCGRSEGTSFRMPDGSIRHICRPCVTEAARARQEA